MPHRYFTPRRATYIVLGLAVIVLGLLIWVVLLSGRVSDQEAIRRAEARGAKAREAQSCLYLLTLIDVAIGIPMQNLDDILKGQLSKAERVDRLAARARYQKSLDTFAPAVAACARR